MHARRSKHLGWLAGALLALAAGSCLAQAWPARSIRVVIPYAPGSLADAVPRIIQTTLEQRLGQRLVIEHRPGAGGNIGAQATASAPPDGYSMLMVATNNLVINQFMYPNMGFDPLRDLAPVSLIAEVPLVLSVHPSVPATTLREFVDHARANPGKLNYGSPSAGTIPHLGAELLAQLLGIRVVHVPFKGGSPATTALLANDIQFMFIGQATLAGQIRAGQVRALAVASGTRLAGLPGVPTFAEAGFRDLDLPGNWWGMVAPRATDTAILERMASEIRAALGESDAQKKYQDVGLTPVGSTPAQFAERLPREAARWEKLVKQLGVKAE